MRNILDKSELHEPYTLISNALIEDGFLSANAKWVYCFLRSKPDTWLFYPKDLLRHCNFDERDFNEACKELADAGWMIIDNENNPEIGLSYQLLDPYFDR